MYSQCKKLLVRYFIFFVCHMQTFQFGLDTFQHHQLCGPWAILSDSADLSILKYHSFSRGAQTMLIVKMHLFFKAHSCVGTLEKNMMIKLSQK